MNLTWQEAVNRLRAHMNEFLRLRDVQGYQSCASMMNKILEDPDADDKRYNLSLPSLPTGCTY